MLVKHGFNNRKDICNYLKSIGYEKVQTSTVSRYLQEINNYDNQFNNVNRKNSIKRRRRELTNLEKQLVDILGERKIVLASYYYKKVLETFLIEEKELELNEDTIKILVGVAKKGQTAWDNFFSFLVSLISHYNGLTYKKSCFQLKRFIEKYTTGDISPTLAEIKRSVPVFEKWLWQLYYKYNSMKTAICQVEQISINRSDCVSYLTELVNENNRSLIHRDYKPREIKERLQIMAQREQVSFPNSYSSQAKNAITGIYKNSQKIICKLMLYPNGKANSHNLKKPTFKLLNKIITTHLHEFFAHSLHKSFFLRWWYKFGKDMINNLQHDLLTNGRRSYTYKQLLGIKKILIKDSKSGFEEFKRVFNITEEDLQEFPSEHVANGFFFSLINFLMRYFLGANHFRLQKGEYGFIPIYRRDDVQQRYDSLAEGLHMGSFQAIEYIREKYACRKHDIKPGERQKILFMDILLGEVLEDCITRCLVNNALPKTVTHKMASIINAEMKRFDVTKKEAIIHAILMMKKSTHFSNYQESLAYLREVISTTTRKNRLEKEIEDNWKDYDELNSNEEEYGKWNTSGAYIKEQFNYIIDNLLLYGREILSVDA
jgi:hypothetical protein